MKKLLTILLALAMCFSFAACGKKEVTVDEFRQFHIYYFTMYFILLITLFLSLLQIYFFSFNVSHFYK